MAVERAKWIAEVKRLLEQIRQQHERVEALQTQVTQMAVEAQQLRERSAQRQMEQIRRSGESSVAHCQQVQMQLANSVPAN